MSRAAKPRMIFVNLSLSWFKPDLPPLSRCLSWARERCKVHMQDTEFKQVNGNKQHRYSNVAATASVSIGEAQGRKAALPAQLVNRQSYAGLRKMGRATRAAMAGMLVALAIQGIGMLLDRTAGVARVENHVLLNWLNLLFAPFSFISRMYDPDGPMAVSWSGFPLVVFANACYFVASAKVLDLIFRRALRKLENHEAGLKKSPAS